VNLREAMRLAMQPNPSEGVWHKCLGPEGAYLEWSESRMSFLVDFGKEKIIVQSNFKLLPYTGWELKKYGFR